MTRPTPSRWRRFSLNLLACLGGLLAAGLILEILLRLAGPGFLYRSPHEMLATFDYRLGHGRYQPDRQVDMLMPYGDMVGLDQTTKGAIAQPRRVRFRTDSQGFRNDRDYTDEKVLLVGDSFIAGSGGDQEDLLSAKLRRDYGIPAYNLAFPGELHSYVRYVQGFFKTHPSEARVLLFLYEGNDFPQAKPRRAAPAAAAAAEASAPSAFEIHRKEFQQSLKELLVYRFGFSLYHIVNKKLRPQDYGQVTVLKVRGAGDLYLGFLNGYIAVTRRAAYDGGEEFPVKLARIRDRLGGIFFIPTKFRVYYDFLEINPRPSLPNAQWDYLKEQAAALGIRCVDLTGPLQEESRRLLPEGKLTFWKDDSHWNGYGMAVAARTIRDFLQER
jgi:hypothetical protein